MSSDLFNHFKSLISLRLDDMDLSAHKAAKKFDLPPDAIRRILEGVEPGFERLEEVCKALGIELKIGGMGINGVAAGVRDDETIEKYVFVPSLALKMKGRESGDPQRLYPFRRDWITKHNAVPKHCFVGRMTGTAMQPDINDGEELLLDTSHKTPLDGKVMGFYLDDDFMVRRMQRAEDGWCAAAANPNSRTLKINLSSAQICGLVFGSLRDL